jgi:MinD-like ATPase involved in chromosome partitioning or flagellar assembly
MDAEPDGAPADDGATSEITREELYPRPMRGGRPVPSGPVARSLRSLRSALSSELARRGAQYDERLAQLAPVTRPNLVAVISPKGGVGKTAISFALGNLFASELRLRVVALDANPDYGTLGALAGDGYRCERSLADLLADRPETASPADLLPYVSRLPSGLHLLGSPAHAEVMAELTPALYARLLATLVHFYELVILDLGPGITSPLTRFAVDRADQSVIVTTPEWITSASVLGALSYMHLGHATLVLNQAHFERDRRQVKLVEESLRKRTAAKMITIPHDPRLRSMLDTGTYEFAGLRLATRVALKELAVEVAGGLS